MNFFTYLTYKGWTIIINSNNKNDLLLLSLECSWQYELRNTLEKNGATMCDDGFFSLSQPFYETEKEAQDAINNIIMPTVLLNKLK